MPHDPAAASKASLRKLSDLDAIEAALKSGEPVEQHLKYYKRLAAYVAGFRQRNQDLIDQVANMRDELNSLYRMHGGPRP